MIPKINYFNPCDFVGRSINSEIYATCSKSWSEPPFIISHSQAVNAIRAQIYIGILVLCNTWSNFIEIKLYYLENLSAIESKEYNSTIIWKIFTE